MLKRMFETVRTKDVKTIAKEATEATMEEGLNQIHGAIRSIYYGLLIKVVVGIVVIVGVITGTIYGVSYLFSGVA